MDGGRTCTPSTLALALCLGVLLLAGCDLAPRPATEPTPASPPADSVSALATKDALATQEARARADATQTAMWESYPGPTIDPEALAAAYPGVPEGYPAPPRTRTPDATPSPRPTATALPPVRLAGVLPSDARPSDTTGQRVHAAWKAGRDLRLLDYARADACSGFALVNAEADPAELLFDSCAWLEAQGREGDTLRPVEDHALQGSRVAGPSYWLQAGDMETRDLVVLDVLRDPGAVALQVAGLPSALRTYVDPIDLDGDGRDELLIRASDGPYVEDEMFERAVYASTSGDEPAKRIAELPEMEQLYDHDGDGRIEALQRLGDSDAAPTGWRSLELREGSWVEDGTLPPVAPFDMAVVRHEALPELPADLWFWEEGAIKRWPAAGGAVETVMVADPGDGYSALTQALDGDFRARTEPGRGSLIGWLSSEDGGVIARLERVQPRVPSSRGDPGAPFSPIHIRVLDRVSGNTTWIEPGRYLVSWALSPDGTALALLVDPAADEPLSLSPFERGATLELQVHDARSGELLWRQACEPDGPEGEPYPLPCLAALRFSPEGDELAYADGRAQRALSLTDGSARTIAPHNPDGPRGIFRVAWHPNAWLADGQALLSRVTYYEGAGWGLASESWRRGYELPGSSSYARHVPASVSASAGGRYLGLSPARPSQGLSPTELQVLDASSIGPTPAETAVERLGPRRVFFEGGVELSLVARDDGGLRYAIRRADDAYLGNAILERDTDGRERVVHVLPRLDPSQSSTWHDAGWAPDGAALLYRAWGERVVALIDDDRSPLYALDGLLHNARWPRWLTASE